MSEKERRREAIAELKDGAARIRQLTEEQQDKLIELLHARLVDLVIEISDVQTAANLLVDVRRRARV